MTLTNANLYSNSYSQIKAFLNSISGLDPRHRYKANWIHSSMPNINEKGFDGYPFIVLLIDLIEEIPSFDGITFERIFRTQIIIYADEPTHLDEISDKIARDYKNESYLTDFQGKELNSSPINYTMDMKGKKILYRSLWLTFTKRI